MSQSFDEPPFLWCTPPGAIQAIQVMDNTEIVIAIPESIWRQAAQKLIDVSKGRVYLK